MRYFQIKKKYIFYVYETKNIDCVVDQDPEIILDAKFHFKGKLDQKIIQVDSAEDKFNLTTDNRENDE